ncbi:CopG family transcriptional regulator [bacterium]|nr:CopG family transcriptional regulator [bacterium]
MPKTITLRLNDKTYEIFRNLAKDDNRSMSNFIETAVLKFIEYDQYADEFEMDEIKGNKELNKSIRQALNDVKSMKGQFIE